MENVPRKGRKGPPGHRSSDLIENLNLQIVDWVGRLMIWQSRTTLQISGCPTQSDLIVGCDFGKNPVNLISVN